MSFKKKIARILRKAADNLSDNNSSKKPYYTSTKVLTHNFESCISSGSEGVSRTTEENELWDLINNNYSYFHSLKEHWSQEFIMLARISDDWKSLPDNELFDGEINASVTVLGKYIIRSSKRVYEKKCIDDRYFEAPASSEVVQQFKGINLFSLRMQFKLREINNYDINIYHEIYVKQAEDDGSDFTRLARARVSRTGAWSESISHIILAKESKKISDKNASLIAHVSWSGDSHSTDTWFKFDSNGKMARLKLGGYGNDEGEKFEPFSGEW